MTQSKALYMINVLYILVFQNMDARTENDLKVLELLLNNSDFYNYSIDEMNFNIETKDQKQVYAIRKDHIQKIAFLNHSVDQSRVQIIMDHAGYFYVNLTKMFISVGL